MGRFARNLTPIYAGIREDIFKLADALNITPNHHQALLFDAVMRAHNGNGPLKIAAKSGQGTGKTTGSVVVALWRTLQAVDALTILTAPTMRQCNEVWLAEARRVMAKADPWLQRLVEITKTKIQIAKRADWGVKTVTATKEENAQGFHEPNMTIIMEEASGIGRKIVEQFKGTASNPNCLMLMIGNPNTRDCAFFDCFNSQRAQWQTLTFNAEETQKSEWFDPKRNQELADEYGKESDIYRIRVLGEFPHSDPNCVMSSEDIEACTNPLHKMACIVRHPAGRIVRQFGIDLARFGGDESTIFRRSGEAIVQWWKQAHVDPSEVIDLAFRMQHEAMWSNNETWFVPDAGGLGQGIMHKFHNAGRRVMEFHNGGRASDTKQYENRVTEAWFQLAKKVRRHEVNLPPDNLLIQQMSSRQYFNNKKGKLVLESKEDFMKRGFDSPDRADGCVLAMYDNVNATANISLREGSGRLVGEGIR